MIKFKAGSPDDASLRVNSRMEFGPYLTTWDRLLKEAQIVGSDLAVTDTATGNRESIFDGGSGRWINKVAADLTTYSPGTTKAGDPDFVFAENSATIIQDADDRGYLSPNMSTTSGQVYTVSFTITENTFTLSVGAFQDEKTGGTTQTVAAGYTGDFEYTWTSGFSGTSGLRVGPGITGAQAGQMTITNLRVVASPSGAPAFPVGTGSGYVMPDNLTVNNIPLYSSMAGATNLVDTDLTNWSVFNPSDITVSEPSAYVYRLDHNGNSVSSVYDSFTQASLNRFGKCQARLVSGTLQSSDIFSLADNGVDRDFVDLSATLTSSWTDLEVNVTSAVQTNQLVFELAGSAAKVIEVRFVRATDTTYPVAPFPNGSAAGATYGADLLSCTPSWGSAGTIVQVVKPYGWLTANAPNSFPATFSEDSLGNGASIRYDVGDTEWVYDDPIDATTVLSSTDITDSLQILSYAWDGVNIYGRLDKESEVSKVNSNTPSATLYIGDWSGGTREFHGLVATLLFNRVLTDAEYETLRAGLQTRLSGVTYQ